jgi:hypothetical protein
MQSQTLELPGLWEATALATCSDIPELRGTIDGIVPRARRNDSTGTGAITWQARGRIQPAANLLAALESGGLATLQPEHPLLSVLYYLEIQADLTSWAATNLRPMALRSAPASRLLRLVPAATALRPHDLIAPLWESAPRPHCALGSIPYAALAILCGFVPAPHLDHAIGSPRWCFAAESLTRPGLTMDLLSSSITAATPAHTATIEGLPPGEHPACYALAAAITLADFQQAEKLAMKNPTHQFKSNHGPQSALMSEAFLAPGAPSRYRDKLLRHLA